MTVSASGLGTLIFLIVIGPFVYFCRWLVQKYRGIDASHHDHNNVSTGTDGRETFDSTAYIFALVGYAIGIGNVWRFPYVISRNGGAAAVVAYLICAIFVAVPLFLYEMILGQYTRLSFIEGWEHIRPRWFSFGWAQFLLLFIVQSYFSMIITYTIPYIVASCVEPLPWTENGSLDFWTNDILNAYPKDELDSAPPGPGPIQWQLAVSLFVFWVITYLSVAFGMSVLAKITYVTVITPVVLMIVLVIITALQSGALEGIQYYIGKFEASELAKLDVWATALGQILFSLSPGFGTAITYSSFVKPKEDVYRACMIVAVCNSAFSILGGFAVFSMVGHLAHEQGLPVEEVATKGGMGLAFVIIAEAMTLFGSAENAMSVLFYVMLFTLGLDSSYAWTETIVSAVEDFMKKKGIKRPTWQTTLVLCIIMFLFGLVFTTRMGSYILDVIDMYVGTIFLLIVCFIESVILNVDFSWRRLAYALKSATIGNRFTPKGRNVFPRWLCRIDFHATVPLATLFLGVYLIYNVAKEPYGGYPMRLLAWGWTLLAICIATVFLTIWKCDKGSLPAIKEDKTFKVLFEDKADSTVKIKEMESEESGAATEVDDEEMGKVESKFIGDGPD